MASIHLGSFNAYNSSYGAYNVYFQYDGTTRNGTTINVINARVYYERIGNGFTTNRIATSGSCGNGQNAWSNVTLNPSGTQSPASMTHTLGTLAVTGVDFTTSTISVNVQAKGTGSSSLWTNTSGTVQLNNTFNISVPVINISTVTATNANIGSASSININRYSSAFTHALYYKFAGQSTWTLIAGGVATSYGWTVPTSAYALIPNAKTINCEILCETYNGASYIGSNTTSMTASVDEVTNAPDVSAVITDVNSITVALTGNNNNIVKFISNARTQITATAKNSSTISSYKVTCGDGKSASTQDSTLNAVESGSFTVEATDSRGIKKTVVYNKTLIVYTKLTLNPTFYRTQPTNNEIAVTYNGNYFNDTFGSTANTLALKYRYREVGGTWSSYINLTPTKSGNTYSNGASPTILGSSFDYTKAYQFEIIANDQIYTGSEIINSPTVARGIPVYWWKKLGMYIEEKLYAKKGLDVTGELTINAKTLLDRTYPVGAIYQSTVATSPATLFGGTWVQLSDRFLIGASGTYANGSTGGASTHTLTITEMPNHNHNILLSATTPGVGNQVKIDNWSWSTNNQEFNGTVRGTGGSAPHNNMPPYRAVYMWYRSA